MRTETEYVQTTRPLTTVLPKSHSVCDCCSLALTDVASALHADAWHEMLRRGDVRHELRQSVDVAEPIPEPDVGPRQSTERLLAHARIGLCPRLEPGVDRGGCARVHFVGDDVGE